MTAFVAIDFETSHHQRDCACSVGLVRVEDGKIAQRAYRLIRPPRKPFLFTEIHGLRWRDVADQPLFAEVWQELAPLLDDAELLVAHNAPFDRSVLQAACLSAGLEAPHQPFACTMKLSKQVLGLPRARLSEVCAHLRIPLTHHHALSDAEACARIFLAVQQAQAQAPRLF